MVWYLVKHSDNFARNFIILSVVLHGYESWSVTVREELMKVFENRMLRRIFGPKR